MHLLVLSNEPGGHSYGAETSLLRLCQSLSAKGHTLTLLYHKEGDFLEEYRRFCTHVIRLHSLSVYGILKFVFTLPYFLRDLSCLPKQKYDLIYANQYPYVLFGSVASVVKDLPLLCHHRDGLPEMWSLAFRPAFRRVSMNLFVSQATREEWLQKGLVTKKRSVVVHSGIRTDFFRPPADFVKLRREMGLLPEDKVILFVGRLDSQKGLETLLKAFSIVRQRGIQAKIWIVGNEAPENPGYKKTLASICSEAGIQACARFLGFQKDPLPYYQIADITVLPSVRHESFGRVIIESMACGIPAVASRIGGIPEGLSGPFSKYLFEPGNAAELSNLLEKTLDWRQKNPALGQQCRTHVLSHFTLEKTVDEVEQEMLKVCRGKLAKK